MNGVSVVPGGYTVGQQVKYRTSFGLRGIGTVLHIEGSMVSVGVAKKRDGQWYVENLNHSCISSLDGSLWVKEAVFAAMAGGGFSSVDEIAERLDVPRKVVYAVIRKAHNLGLLDRRQDNLLHAGWCYTYALKSED